VTVVLDPSPEVMKMGTLMQTKPGIFGYDVDGADSDPEAGPEARDDVGTIMGGCATWEVGGSIGGGGGSSLIVLRLSERLRLWTLLM
jgi:hypothetical protein